MRGVFSMSFPLPALFALAAAWLVLGGAADRAAAQLGVPTSGERGFEIDVTCPAHVEPG